MSSILADQAHRQRIVLLMWIAVGSVILWQTVIGSLLLDPFTILATWFHEWAMVSPPCLGLYGSSGSDRAQFSSRSRPTIGGMDARRT
jgi:hypothetical protein